MSLDILTIREIVESNAPGVYLRDLANWFGVEPEFLLNFIDTKRELRAIDPYGQETGPQDMEEVIQIMMLLDEEGEIYYIHLKQLGFVERYRGAWGPPYEETRPQETEKEFPDLDLDLDPYGSFFE